MGIRKWFRRKQDVVAFPEGAFGESREEIYREFFGKPQSVSHEVFPLMPHIDVFVYAPGHAGRTWYTLASGGMSDRPMILEEGVPRSFARRETILYCKTPDLEYIDMVRFFARFPHQNSTWLGPGHTIPNGDPPAPLFENSQLCAVLLLDSVVLPDRQLADKVVLDGDPVDFLWIVPITQAELDYKLKNGCDALLDLFDKVKHPVVLDRGRASYL